MIRVSIYEDNPHLTETLVWIIESCPEFMLVGTHTDPTNVTLDIKKEMPDIIMMDIEMPNMTGIEAVSLITKNIKNPPKVLMLTVFDDTSRIFDAIKAGAVGYLLKKTSADKIIESIKEVQQGGAAMSPSIARKVLTMLTENQTSHSLDNDYHVLSQREKEVLGYLTKGMSYKMIADACGISYGTVNSHLKKIYEKLHVHSATEAVQKAFLQKII